jgi:hypothetical protein
MATVVIQPDATAGKDTWLYEGNPATNYGTYESFSVGRGLSASANSRSLIQFPLTAIPTGEGVGTATVSLYTSSVLEANNHNIGVHEINAAWVETSVTWNAPATYEASALVTTAVGADSAWYDWVISALCKEWHKGSKTNNGVALVGDETVNNTNKVFPSSDHATANLRPKLTIETTARPTKPTLTSMNGTQANPTASNNDVTPNLSGVYASGDSLAMYARQHIIYDELGNTVWDSGKTVAAASSGDTITVTVPMGYLRYGRKYQWKWMAWDENGGYSEYSDLGWFRPTLTTTAAATDLAAGDHLYAQTTTGRIVALEEGTTNLGTAIAWRETFVVPLVNEDDWFKTLFLSRVWGRIYLPVGSTGSVYYSTRMEDLSDGADWETAQALTAQAGIQVFDFAVPFTSGDDFMGNAFRVKVTGTGPHKLHGLKFYYEERDE